MIVTEHETPVLVVGAGPAGLIAALQLAKHGTKCMLIERNLDTTKWPKMDITNSRSMELLKRLNLDQGLREVGVAQHYSLNVNFSTGLSEGGKLVSKWELPSPNDWRTRIKEQNNGTMPREPYQRCSQAIFEAWLKPKVVSEEPLIETYFGWKFQSLRETAPCIEVVVVTASGEEHLIKSQYVIGCDGAGSKVRAAIGSRLVGGPVPGAMHLIHFKSRDLSKLHRQGQFWHTFFTTGAVIISQDEGNTWTLHNPVPIGTDVSEVDPKQTIYKALGGEHAQLDIEIDEILVTSIWRPNIFLADKYAAPTSRIFISGDAAHQNIPTGGYGMNTAVGDSFDIGWKIAAVLAGHGGKYLLDSYEAERRPVAARNIERSGVHHMVHATYIKWCQEAPGIVSSMSETGSALRMKIAEHVKQNDGENTNHGIEMGYRYNNSPIVIGENDTEEPEWTPKQYIPSTWPGARAPHVFLSDNQTSIYDLFGTGNQYTLVDFTEVGSYGQVFQHAASKLHVPLKIIHLPNEPHVQKIWERDAILVRPDDHVSWRSKNGSGVDNIVAADVLGVATGKVKSKSSYDEATTLPGGIATFTGTTGHVQHGDVRDLGPFQK